MTRAPLHHTETEQLLRYLDGDLPWLARRASRRHLAQCGHCRAQLEAILQVENAILADCRQIDAELGGLPGAVRDEMRTELAGRLRAAAAGLPDAPRIGWPLGSKLVFAAVLLAGAALATVGFRLWTAKPAVHRDVSPAPPPPGTATSPAVRPPGSVRNSAQADGQSLEVAALAALHRLGADLGDPIRVSEGGHEVTVFCGDVGPDRELEIRTALATIPGITFRMEAVEPVRSSAGVVALTPLHNALATRLESAWGGTLAFQAAANSVVDEDEQLMAVAHALHNLDLRFPAEREAALNAHDRELLRGIRADLEASFRGHARKLLALIVPARRALAAKSEAGGSGIFESARRIDRVVLVLFAGAATSLSTEQLASEFEGAAAQLTAACGGTE